MKALQQPFLSSSDKAILTAFVNILQKRGNKQRALSSLFCLFTKLKRGLAGFPIVETYPLHKLNAENPLQILHKSLYNLKPAFILRRIIKSGRLYQLPVPISERRATFMAVDWLRKVVLKNNKNALSFTSLLAREISASLYNQGSAKGFLKAYIDLALDQRPFSRFIKRKRYIISKSKRTNAAERLKKMFKNMRRQSRARKYRNKGIMRKLNIHNLRTSLAKDKKNKRKKAQTKKQLKTFKA